MRCGDIMRKNVVVCGEEETIRSAARAMRDENVGFLPVRDRDGRITGAITDRDLVLRVLADGADIHATRVGAVMTREVYFCQPTDPIKEAEELMARRRIQRVMILDPEGTLLGVVSLSDLGQWSWRVARTMREVARRETAGAR
jgi:CBS domain-containing protein